jgi:DNA-binding NtrC family response regulator
MGTGRADDDPAPAPAATPPGRPRPRVLIVEDQPAVARAIRLLLEVHDLPCAVATSPDEALDLVDREELGAMLQDMNFGPSETDGARGLELFRRVRALDPGLPVLALTAWASLETAVAMVKEGAADYLAKPWDDAKLIATVRNLVRLRELELENQRLVEAAARDRRELSARYQLGELVYRSPVMHRVVSLAAQVASADVPVLVTGPNGSGKEMIADLVQVNSRRRDQAFVKVNVGALPDELLEAELFGAEAGAYTGSVRRRIGRFEAADQGTLFLDEIANLSPAGQAKLLRVLQSGELQRVGSSETRRVDVRIIAATNADLGAAMAAGRFREDLFFRLNVIEIRVPPLSERPEDVLPLAESFLERLGQGDPRRLGREARAALEAHTWTGNVRELHNRLQRAFLIGAGAEIQPDDLGLGARPSPVPAPGGAIAPSAGPRSAAEAALPAPIDPEADREERRRLEALLVESGGMVSRAAARLGISRQALYRRMERLGIALERRPRS